MPRPKLKEDDSYSPKAGNYFIDEKTNLEFIHTGCTLLDMVLGGGWVLGRIGNIIGSEATGKTLLAIEAAANFHKQYPDGKIFYRESEAAFDVQYAEALGMPVDEIDFGTELFTVEDWTRDILGQIDSLKENQPALYILDSLDALTDEAERKRDIDEASMGVSKARRMSELFRRVTQHVESHRVCLLIISQIRDNIGVSFGRKWSSGGGKALPFYATHRLFLTHKKQLKKTKNGIERVYGTHIEVNCIKNKISMPFRKCEFDILFGYGIDNEAASIDWLIDEPKAITPAAGKKIYNEIVTGAEAPEMTIDMLNEFTKKTWRETEATFLPDRVKKY